MNHAVRLLGRGRVQLAAYGVADAEHQVEKEIAAAWPEAQVGIAEIGRAAHAGRIVEEFAVAYQIRGTLDVESSSPEEARSRALRTVRERFNQTRFRHVAWDQVEVSA